MNRPPIVRDELPKGMTPASPNTEAPPNRPAPLTCAAGNYAGAIRQALAILPVEIRVDRLIVVERDGLPSQVSLKLTILGEKGGGDPERFGDEVQPAQQDLHVPGP